MKFYLGEHKERIGYDFFCDIAERVVEARERKGWRQKDLAKAAGLTQAKISDMENVKIRFDLSDIEKLAKALNVSVDWLIDAELDHYGKECLYLVWNEKDNCRDPLKLYFDATSARMAYLKAHAWSREFGVIRFKSRDRAVVQLVGVPVEEAELEAKFPKRISSEDDAIEPDEEAVND